MNNFTKEELEDLLHSVRFVWKKRNQYDLPSDKEDCSFSYDLMNKIQSMIDSYSDNDCNHAWVLAKNEPTSIDDCVLHFWACVKCHETIGDIE